MTYEEIFKQVKKNFEKANVKNLKREFAFQFNITGEGEGIFYAAFKNGVLSVEPYDYKDRDVIFTADGKTLIDISAGKTEPIDAIEHGRLAVEGNELSNQLMTIIPASKKASAKKAEEKPAPKKEVKAAPKKEVKAAPKKADTKPEAKKEAKPAAKAASKAEAKPAAPKAEAKNAVKAAAPKAETKPAIKQEASKAEAKPAVKQEAAKAEAKPAVKQEAPKAEAKSAAPAVKAETKSDKK